MTRYLVTSALQYVNGIKHLGNLIGSMLPADVYTRLLRREGEEVLFICGTDEHGTPSEISAFEEGLDVRTYCDRMYERQAGVYRRFGLSFDYFGRSSSRQNAELTQHFFTKLDENGFAQERDIQQVYSPEDGRFLPDRYIVGTCPRCGYTAARGDQCEDCGILLDPPDLIEPRSALSGSTKLELRVSRQLFLRLDLLAPEIERWVKSHEGEWPKLTYSVAMEFRKGVLALKRLWSLGNLYIDTRAPWNLVKTSRDEAAVILRTCVNLVRTFALASWPIIPFTSEKMFDALKMTAEERSANLASASDLTVLKPGREFEVPPVLVKKIEPEDVARSTKESAGGSV